MSIVIDLPDEKTTLLSQEAARRGMTAQAYARSAVEAMLERDLAQATPRKRNVMEFFGVGKQTWEGTDVDAYINELHEEWDGRE